MIILLLSLLAFSACGSKQDPNTIAASGHVEATDVRVGVKWSGNLQSFSLQEGDPVTEGQELARIGTIDVDLRIQQAGAEENQAQAELNLLLAGARKEDIAELEAQIAGAEADLTGTQKDLERMQELVETGIGTEKNRDDAKTRTEIASARLKALRQSLARMKAGSRTEEIEASRARVAAAAARIAQLEQQIKDSRVLSPLNGMLTEKIAEQGEMVQPGSLLCVISDLQHPWLTVYVGEPDLARIRLGQEAEVITDAGQKRAGKITYISSRAEFTPKNVQTQEERVKLVFKVKIGLPNEDGIFKPGMPAEARFRKEP